MIRVILIFWALLALLVAPALAQGGGAPLTLTRFGAEGGDFRAELSDGRILRGADLIGAELNMTEAGTPYRLRIATAEPEAGGFAPDLWLFHLILIAPDGTARDHCEPDPEGRSLAIPYPAPDQPLGFTLTCTSGAVGKCMRAGYRPWALAADGITPLAPYHAACVNLFRAAYGGPDQPWTRDGMRIDLYDRIGIQQPDRMEGQSFEAGWTPEGAVCLAHPRVPENGSLEEIAAAIPRLIGRTGPEFCTEARAAALGALVFNRSDAPRQGMTR
ncbi:hypothetical protein KTR66_17935 [Roseococcus sp. SDR]|uniref:ADYC domain-containing protein n=1 Tax=Roseococcus sp. SDR TaxID=2835532 RepID=UPI001BCDB6AE|nr:ADYC domain-containing protein [Roseococcus sp. SDR]MBS7791885.1 hypothetical protein [Roseococcus sp. SDR]MBV1847199.1 hypothetical protein [Roseococcus sp. SDR]